MRENNEKIIYITFLSALLLTSCSKEPSIATSAEVSEPISVSEETTTETSVISDNKPEPELMQIRNICKLATIKCCYNNVAKSVKVKEQDRLIGLKKIEYFG